MISGHWFAVHLPRQKYIGSRIQCSLQWNRLLVRITRCAKVDMSVAVRVVGTGSAGFIDIVSRRHQDITKTHASEVGSTDRTDAPCQAGSLAIRRVVHLASTIAGTLLTRQRSSKKQQCIHSQRHQCSALATTYLQGYGHCVLLEFLLQIVKRVRQLLAIRKLYLEMVLLWINAWNLRHSSVTNYNYRHADSPRDDFERRTIEVVSRSPRAASQGSRHCTVSQSGRSGLHLALGRP